MIEEVEENDIYLRLLEAILFASAEPMTVEALQKQLGGDADAFRLLLSLKEKYAARGVNLVETGGMWSFRTAPDLAPMMTIVRQPRRKLPRAAAEVLAIIAYHQPVTRAEIESIRGVETGRGTIDMLLELGWIRPGKPRETPGRPLTWKTTPAFLSHFNLASLDELPGMEELKAAGLLDSRPAPAGMPRENDEEEAAEAGLPDAEGDSGEELAEWLGNEAAVR